MSIKTKSKSTFNRSLLKVQKHSPALLFGAGIVGFVSTVVLATRATMKLSETLDDIEAKKTAHEMTTFENDKEAGKALNRIHLRGAIDVARLYAPAVIIGAVSVGALTTSHVVLNKRYAGMSAAYAAIDQVYREYRERVTNEFGAEKEAELRYGLVDKVVAVEGENGIEAKTLRVAAPQNGLSGYAKCFDETNRNWRGNEDPSYNRTFIMTVQNYATDKLRDRDHIFLNEVYDMLGMARTPAGSQVGWIKGKGDQYVSFGVFSGDQFMGERFVMGEEGSIWLDFNVAGEIWNLI